MSLTKKEARSRLREADRYGEATDHLIRNCVKVLDDGCIDPSSAGTMKKALNLSRLGLASYDLLSLDITRSGLGDFLLRELALRKLGVRRVKGCLEELFRDEDNMGPNRFDRLPAELIAHIFLIGVRDERHDPRGMTSIKEPFTLIVSSVCRRWREIALSTPTMWQYITMTEADPEYNWTRLWLERSKEAPLDLDLYYSADDDKLGEDPLTEEEVYRVRDILFPHAHRWREFSYNVDTFNMNYILLLSLVNHQQPLSLLESFMLYNNSDFDPLSSFALPYHISPVHLPSNLFPRVNTVELWGVHVAWESWPFKNLVSLSLSYHAPGVSYTPAQFISMLHSSPQLSFLKLDGSGPFPPGVNISLPYTLQLVLPHLKTLHIGHVSEASEIRFLLHLLRAPNLETFVMKDWYDDDFSDIIAYLGSSTNANHNVPLDSNSSPSAYSSPPRQTYSTGYPSITRLNIAGIESSIMSHAIEAFKRLFVDLNRLTHLSINCRQMSIRTFESLIPQHGQKATYTGGMSPRDNPIDTRSTGEGSGSGDDGRRDGEQAPSIFSSTHSVSSSPVLLPLLHTLKPFDVPWDNLTTFLSRRYRYGVPVRRILIRQTGRRRNAHWGTESDDDESSDEERAAKWPPPVEEWKRYGCEVEYYDEDSEDEEVDLDDSSEGDESSVSSSWSTDEEDDGSDDGNDEDDEDDGDDGNDANDANEGDDGAGRGGWGRGDKQVGDGVRGEVEIEEGATTAEGTRGEGLEDLINLDVKATAVAIKQAMEVALADIARARARTASAVGGNDQVPSGGVAGDTADELASGQSGVGGSGAMIADVLTAGTRKPRDPLEPVLENLIGNSSDYNDNILDGVLQADGGGGTGGGTINYRTLIATTTAAANTLMAHGDPDSDMEMEDGDVDEDNASSSSSLDGRDGIDGQEEHGLDPLYFFNSPLSNRSRNRGRGQVQGNRVRRATITGGDSDVSTDELNF